MITHRPVSNGYWLRAIVQAHGHPAATSQQKVTTGNASGLTGHWMLVACFDAGSATERRESGRVSSNPMMQGAGNQIFLIGWAHGHCSMLVTLSN